MALVKPLIFQVVGYQNSGKTTFLEKLIRTLAAQGLKTVTIKHHGHGGKPDVVQYKDSSRHLDAGALASLAEGDGRIVLQAESSEWCLEQQIELMKFFSPEIIFIEGHKHKPFPKLLILRDEKDFSLLSKVVNTIAILVWKEEWIIELQKKLEVPILHIADENAIPRISNALKQLVRKMD